MPTLALPISNSQGELNLLAGRYRFEFADGPMAVANLGRAVILFQPSGSVCAQAVATAKLTRLEPAPDQSHIVGTMAELRYFRTPVPAPDLAASPAIQAIDSKVSASIIDIGMTVHLADETFTGFSEAQTAFFLGTDTEHPVHDDFHVRALERFNHTCVFTGKAFQPAQGLYPGLDLIAIRPVELGGQEILGNVLAASPEAAKAFSRGHMAIGQRHELLIALDRIDPELLDIVNASGRLWLPPDSAVHPDPANLRYHRRYIFSRNQPV